MCFSIFRAWAGFDWGLHCWTLSEFSLHLRKFSLCFSSSCPDNLSCRTCRLLRILVKEVPQQNSRWQSESKTRKLWYHRLHLPCLRILVPTRVPHPLWASLTCPWTHPHIESGIDHSLCQSAINLDKLLTISLKIVFQAPYYLPWLRAWSHRETWTRSYAFRCR